ncbi:hypothetical protein DL98DRAFT_186635 [Cadophora sp. DSE1049]|nr:hypothetical protein DL98DRAFT_186635 [Cadophora sp. DSE1049]
MLLFPLPFFRQLFAISGVFFILFTDLACFSVDFSKRGGHAPCDGMFWDHVSNAWDENYYKGNDFFLILLFGSLDSLLRSGKVRAIDRFNRMQYKWNCVQRKIKQPPRSLASSLMLLPS